MKTDLKKKYANKGARGLANIGSTCYLNTALQCLSHCLPFLDIVLLASDTEGLMGSLKDLLQTLWIEQKGVAPHKFAHTLSSTLSSAMNIKEENDVQEFMSVFLDKLNQCVGIPVPDEIIHKFSECDKRDPKVLFHTNARLAWLKDHKLSYSHLIDMFYGQQVNQIQCDACHGIGHVFETFGSVMVSLSQTGSGNEQCLGELIEATLKKEGVDSRECDFCKKRTSGTTVQRFYRLPTVLMVNIKRFDSNMQKIRAPVTTPTGLDLSRVCLDTTQSHSYELASIACHMGGLGSGHYFAVCKHPCGRWLIIDDDVVKAIEGPHDVPSQCFYTVFYVKN